MPKWTLRSEPPDRLVRGGSNMSAALAAFDVTQRHMADDDDIAVLELGLGDAYAVDLHAIEAAVVEDHGGLSALGDQRVPTRYRSIVEQNVSRRTPADVHVLCSQEEQEDVLAVFHGQVPPGGDPRQGQGHASPFLLFEARQGAGLLCRRFSLLRSRGGD